MSEQTNVNFLQENNLNEVVTEGVFQINELKKQSSEFGKFSISNPKGVKQKSLNKPLNGKYALITGSSRGIGKGIALKFAEIGAKIAINYYKNEGAARETLSKIQELGSDGIIVQSDISNTDGIMRMFETVEREFGELDIFISNALVDLNSVAQLPMDITLDKWNKVFDSQAKAFLLGCQQSARLMRNGGRILAISYNPGVNTGGWQTYVSMGSAKAAIESLCRYFAVSLAKQGITVNAIRPGFTEDTALNSFPEKIQNAMRSWHEGGWTPRGRLARPEDIANAVALLCLEETNWITGQVLTVDGGASLMNRDFPLDVQLGNA